MLSLRATIVEWNARSTHESPSGRALCDVGCYPVIIGGRRHPYSRRRRRRRFSPHPFGASRMLLLPTRTRRSYVRSVELHHRPQSRLDLPAGQRETRTSVLGAWDSHAVARYSSVLKTLGDPKWGIEILFICYRRNQIWKVARTFGFKIWLIFEFRMYTHFIR